MVWKDMMKKQATTMIKQCRRKDTVMTAPVTEWRRKDTVMTAPVTEWSPAKYIY